MTRETKIATKMAFVRREQIRKQRDKRPMKSWKKAVDNHGQVISSRDGV